MKPDRRTIDPGILEDPEPDRANRERARDLALACFALLAILAIALWWTQR